MDQFLDGTTALVTGGGTGIGRASAIALAAAGCTVTVASDRSTFVTGAAIPVDGGYTTH